MKLLFVSTLCIAVAGCVAPRHAPVVVTEELKARADYGAYPDNYEEIIKAKMQTVLKDPQSAQYRFIEKPSKSDNKYIVESLSEVKFYYTIVVFINAKNSYGGYVGEHEYIFKIRNGVVIDFGDVTEARINLGI